MTRTPLTDLVNACLRTGATVRLYAGAVYVMRATDKGWTQLAGALSGRPNMAKLATWLSR